MVGNDRLVVFVLSSVLALPWLALAGSVTMAQGAPPTIKIGHAISMTGPAASIGEQYKLATIVAVKEIANDGGLFGKQLNKRIPVKLISGDDEGRLAVCVRMTERLVNRDQWWPWAAATRPPSGCSS